jgi:hypothetical protein
VARRTARRIRRSRRQRLLTRDLTRAVDSRSAHARRWDPSGLPCSPPTRAHCPAHRHPRRPVAGGSIRRRQSHDHLPALCPNCSRPNAHCSRRGQRGQSRDWRDRREWSAHTARWAECRRRGGVAACGARRPRHRGPTTPRLADRAYPCPCHILPHPRTNLARTETPRRRIHHSAHAYTRHVHSRAATILRTTSQERNHASGPAPARLCRFTRDRASRHGPATPSWQARAGSHHT